MRPAANRRRRRGTILAYFALLVFALMGMAALVVDMGLVINTQRSMRGAVDSAALEGLRFRDDPTIPDAGERDLARRKAASNLVANIFDDDFNPSNGDPLQIGAGPVLNLTPQNALQVVVGVPGQGFNRVYKPNNFSQVSPTVQFTPLQTNDWSNLAQGDQAPGDMVAGTFLPGLADAQSLENNQYQRQDFTPSTSAEAASTAPSFLVRMRRTNNFLGLDSETGVSSQGPTLPLLFGRATMIAQNSSGYNPRTHGFTVRATAIADARRAKSVGPVYPATVYTAGSSSFAGIAGLAPFGLSLNYWNATTPAGDRLSVNVNGMLTPAHTGTGQMLRITSLAANVLSTDTTISVATAVGFPATVPFNIRIDNELAQVTAVSGLNWTVQRAQETTTAAAHTANAPVTLHTGMTLGRRVDNLATPPPVVDLSSPRPAQLDQFVGSTFATFVPLFDDATGFVVGFGQVTWSVASWSTSGGFIVLITKQPSTIAVKNATAVFNQTLPSFLTSDALTALMAEHAALSGSILVPALVR